MRHPRETKRPREERQRPSIRPLNNSRIHNTWPVAREGLPFIGTSCGLALLLACIGLPWAATLMGVLALFVIFFFRDPERSYHGNEPGVVLTPADGTILEVRPIDGAANPIGRSAVKVSIFMSIFNVHVNRIPVSGTIEDTRYTPGKFFSANLDKASSENEQHMIVMKTDPGGPIAVVQIAGLIARRIACWVQKGDRVLRGQRFGLIRFGSRLEVYLPAESRIMVKVHQKVKAGMTPIGYLP